MLIHKKKCNTFLVGAALSLLTCNAIAGYPGPYFGLQYGWAEAESGISDADINTLIRNGLNGYSNYHINSYSTGALSRGAGGRIFLGFQFNCNWAAEFGWSRLPNVPVVAQALATNLANGAPITADGYGSIQVSALDLVAKAIVPLGHYFNLYGKFGLAWLEGVATEHANVNGLGATNIASNNDTTQRYYPTFGVGMAYDFTRSVVGDISWNRIQKIGNARDLGSTDLISVGLAYNFGPYCPEITPIATTTCQS